VNTIADRVRHDTPRHERLEARQDQRDDARSSCFLADCNAEFAKASAWSSTASATESASLHADSMLWMDGLSRSYTSEPARGKVEVPAAIRLLGQL